jgi:hypothetical protein
MWYEVVNEEGDQVAGLFDRHGLAEKARREIEEEHSDWGPLSVQAVESEGQVPPAEVGGLFKDDSGE